MASALPGTCFQRLHDFFSQSHLLLTFCRAASSGRPLPSPRFVSRASHPDDGFHDHAVTILLVAWGQFLDHDITLSAETRDPRTGKTPKCCEGSGPGPAHPNCLPIEIPSDDGFYGKYGQRCMNFVRTISGLRYNCRLGPRASFNEISSIIDAGTVYSNSPETLEELRAFKGGLLKVCKHQADAGPFTKPYFFCRCFPFLRNLV